MGSLGESDAEKGGLNSLTYTSPPEWECPPVEAFRFIMKMCEIFVANSFV